MCIQGENEMNEVVKFPINTLVEVTLQCEAGKHVEGRYGDQVMYSLLDNRVIRRAAERQLDCSDGAGISSSHQ
jgi:hypothetical protein